VYLKFYIKCRFNLLPLFIKMYENVKKNPDQQKMFAGDSVYKETLFERTWCPQKKNMDLNYNLILHIKLCTYKRTATYFGGAKDKDYR